jgi:hypothetical protein
VRPEESVSLRIGSVDPRRSTNDSRLDIVRIPTQLWRKYESLPSWWLLVLLLLNACGGAETGCDSLVARTSVVKIISDDSNNALLNYAVKNSSSVAATVSATNTEAEKLAALEHARQGAVYELDDTTLTNSRRSSTGVISCSALLSVTVGDTTAQKQVDFKIEPTTNGKIAVSVSPFLF